MSTTVAVKPVRKFPPPCWTRDEALVLIDAYRQRWYALHRAFLKNPDWDAVAEKVTTAFPNVTPPKTSAQCRHKMEKLRQRHRAEKLRASSFFGGRFVSSWFYFEAMEAMENNNNNNNNDPNSSEIFKPTHVQNLVTLAVSPDFDSKVLNHSSLYKNNRSNSNQEHDNGDGFLVDSVINETSGHPVYKNYYKHSLYTGGTRVKSSLGSHQRKFSKVVHDHEDEEMWVKVARNRNMFLGNNEIVNKNHGKKRGNDGMNEVVSSIKLLGDGFMKMEKMKMDMGWEIERMRMEAEIKRNELILETQKEIVEALVKGWIGTRKQSRTA